MNENITLYTDYLFKKNIKVEIDRPLGSKHPKCELIYTLNYGYVPNTRAGDGEEIDVYVLGVDTSIDDYQGECIAIICRYNDNENKLIIAPEGVSFTDNEIMKLINFNEGFFDSIVVRTIEQYSAFLKQKEKNT